MERRRSTIISKSLGAARTNSGSDKPDYKAICLLAPVAAPLAVRNNRSLDHLDRFLHRQLDDQT